MIASKTLLALFAAATAVSARVVPRATPPAGWWTAGLEDYDAYHTRYLALGCQNNHGQAFFDQCCHPLKKDETLETARPPQCIPSASASVSASLAEPTSTVTTPDDEPPTSVTASASGSASASASPVTNIADDEGDDDDCDSEDDEGDDEDDEDCEDDGDDEGSSSASSFSSTAAPTSTKASSSASTAFTATSSKKVFVPESTSTPTSTHSSSSKSSSKASSTKTSSTAASKSTSSSSNGPFTDGVATFFYQGGVAGACGTVHSDSDFIAAIDSSRYGNTGEKSDLCGKQVKITNTDNNKSVTVTIADACPTCNNQDSIDLSTAAFNQIASESTGEVSISWEFV